MEMDASIPAVSTHQTDVRDRRPIRGGVVFPSSLVTTHTDTGFFWRARNGHLAAESHNFTINYSDGTSVNLSTVAGWPVPPTILAFVGGGTVNSVLPAVPRTWPWIQGAAPAPSPNMTEHETITLEEHPVMDRLRQRIPDLQIWREERMQELRQLPFPENSVQLQREWRTSLYVPQELDQRIDDAIEALMGQQGIGWENGGLPSFNRR